MQALKITLKQSLTLIFFSTLLSAFNPAMAETDLVAQEKYLKARIMSGQQTEEHLAHINPIDKSQQFHGIFYGFLPCNDCNGIKATLSLKQNNNYLLVTQQAKEASREHYEKGKYIWNDENHTVILTPLKEPVTRKFLIENEGVLIQVNGNGTQMASTSAGTSYILRRSDTVKQREVHMH